MSMECVEFWFNVDRIVEGGLGVGRGMKLVE